MKHQNKDDMSWKSGVQKKRKKRTAPYNHSVIIKFQFFSTNHINQISWKNVNNNCWWYTSVHTSSHVPHKHLWSSPISKCQRREAHQQFVTELGEKKSEVIMPDTAWFSSNRGKHTRAWSDSMLALKEIQRFYRLTAIPRQCTPMPTLFNS